MIDEHMTYGINPWQSVEGMVHDYNAREAAEDAAAYDPDDCSDIPKEEMEPSREGEDLVRRGRLDPETGAEIPLTDKARTVIHRQCCPTAAYLRGYDQIKWNN